MTPFSLSTPRRHPRRKSTSWRSLGWLIEREAAWQILCTRQGSTKAPYTRRGFGKARRYYIRKLAELMLAYHPDRRFS